MFFCHIYSIFHGHISWWWETRTYLCSFYLCSWNCSDIVFLCVLLISSHPANVEIPFSMGQQMLFFLVVFLFHFSHFFSTYAQKEGEKVLLLLLLFFLKPSSGSVWHRHEHSHNQPECASFWIEMKAGNTHTHLYTHACTRQQQEHTNKQAQTHREEAQAIWHSLSV